MHFQKSSRPLGGNMMQSYMESRLTSLHDASAQSVTNYKDRIISFFFGAFVIVLLPYLHIGIFYMKLWVYDKPGINRRNCSCRYENPGETAYKHVYFNATPTTFTIWILTVIFVLMAYESVKYLIPLYRHRNIRRSMLALYLINIYPHYYSWWSYFSYLNEEFYMYFKHHMWFTVTEIFVTCIVLNLCDKRNKIISWKILAIVSVNLMHVLLGGLDQFIAEVLQGHGRSFHKARNIALMLPDILHVVIPLYELYHHAKRHALRITEICYKEELFLCLIFVSMGTLFGRLV